MTLPREMRDRFSIFAFAVVRKYLGHKLTKRQLEICDYMQLGPEGTKESTQDRLVLAYRGIGKTMLASLFMVWKLLINPRELILFVASDIGPANEMGSKCLDLVDTIPEFAPLRVPNRKGVRTRANSWDVPGKDPLAKQSSFTALPYGASSLTGKRATFILLDDWEVMATCRSSVHQANLMHAAEELGNIMSDSQPGWFKLALGTYHVADSFYIRLQEDLDFAARVWPAIYPNPKKSDAAYLSLVAPEVLEEVRANPELVDKPTDRLGEQALMKKPGGIRSARFQLQYMLNPVVSDDDVFPLRCEDLIVMDGIDSKRLPCQIVWTNESQYRRNGIKCSGFAGDAFYTHREIPPDVKYDKPEAVIMYVDTSGLGVDEMVYVVAAVLRGVIFILDMHAYRRNKQEIRYPETAKAAARFGVQKMQMETNTNLSAVDLMRGELDRQGINLHVEGHHNSVKKEIRVINTLSEVMAQHRLVFDRRVLEKDPRISPGAKHYQLVYQLTHAKMQPRLGLKHDDRIDALCGAVEMLSPFLSTDARTADRAIMSDRDKIIRSLFTNPDMENERHTMQLFGRDAGYEAAMKRGLDDPVERLYRARL